MNCLFASKNLLGIMATDIILNQQSLLNTGLFKEWSHEAFNSLKDIDESRHASLDGIAEEMGKDLRETNLNSHIGICRIHNHFKMSPGEVVQLSLGLSIDDQVAKVQSNARVAHLKPVEMKSESEPMPIPYMWGFDKTSHKFFPMQFFDGSNVIMQGRFIEIMAEKRLELIAFLYRFVDRVHATGTEDDLGFYLRYDSLMNKQVNEGLVEDTDVNNRKQWIMPKTKEAMQQTLAEMKKVDQDAFITRTHWYFNEDSESKTIDCCHCSHCCRH
ncbi:unnamed protein product [Rotaria magnacalcarata]|uniref:Uncharacterized protein n=2 Tax=Rotaria magnacalcarata TaxID=392030 RepID=A0A815Q3E8_9BILA|nr:unnamed protein product [Rotaria magnacalcarata]CAF1456977.1 unnamed protein product [Rotaria magnacalcarata]CAF2015266.1 unnamed protein product [Rotaria magnacalcarata]CAF2218368.1 unnamed protein product [Rotaria magnacalcarata]